MTGAGFLRPRPRPGFALAAAGFAVAGFGNGLMLVHERLLFR